MIQRFSLIPVLVAALTLFSLGVITSGSAANASASADSGDPQIISALGVAHIQGQDVIVDVLVAVPRGQDAGAAARAALQGQGARPLGAEELDSAAFSLTGLVWDVFLDQNLSNDSVTVNYNSKGVPANLAALDHRGVWLASQATWTNVATSNFAYADGGDTGRCPSLVRECRGPQKFDANNDVGWLNISDPGVLGVTWYGTSSDEFDMALDNKDFAWYIGDPSQIPQGSFDVETVWLHEFGHGLGLSHSGVDGAVMEPYYEGVRRTLHQDDINGITSLYPSGTPNDTPVVSINSPADGATFDSGANVAFSGSAGDTEDGNLTASLVWTSNIDGQIGTGGSFSAALSDGNHTITASVTDSGGATGTASIVVTVGTVTEPTAVIVDSVSYSTEGGKNGDKHLLVTVALVDDLGQPVSGASVSILLSNTSTAQSWSGTGTTGETGTATFSLKNAPPGHYISTVTGVSASPLTWDGVTPANGLDK